MKMFLGVLLTFVILLLGFIAYAGYPWSLSEKIVHPEIVYVEPEGMVSSEEHPSVIKILTWNLGFLYGEGSEGKGYTPQDKKFYENKLKDLTHFIQDWQPDVICLQEVDFDSHRAHEMNQAQLLAHALGYPYVAEAVSWEANYVPFPYWPFVRHFGYVKSGGAIISKYPLSNHQVTLLPKPLSQSWWYNIFYPHRYFQQVTVEMGETKFKIINLHLEAFDKIDREGQVDRLIKIMKKTPVDFIAGDFNMLPKSALKRSKFRNEDNYENDISYDKAMLMGLSEVIPDDLYSKNEGLYMTFPSSRPDRRLDYIFYRSDLKMMKAEVLPSAISDHLPLRASFQFDSPKFNLYSQ